ncbi:MAG: hypothetical protein WB774_01485 [Xanthobacteraceae bacterium]
MGKGLSRKEIENTINQIVFGVDYKTDKRGEPIEQGKGSAAQPTQQSIDAYAKYCRHEDGFAENLKNMKAALAAYRTAQRER